MATIRKVVGQITLKVIKDVESTTYFYLLLPSTAPIPTKPTTNPPPVFTTTGYDGWSETEPNYTSGDTRSLYVTVRTIYSDGSFEYTTPSLSSSYEAAKQAYNRAQSAFSLADGINNYFWWLTSSTDMDIPTGAYVTNVPQSSFKTNKTGGNVIIQSTGITIRNGTDILASLTGNALNFYRPGTTNIDAQLSSNGLILSKGGIESGNLTSGNGYVYLSTEDKSGITINGYTPGNSDPKWRAIIGTKFGVDSEGNLYASSANLTGSKIGNWYITDTSIQTGNFDTVDTMYFGDNGISLDNTFKVTNSGELVSTAGTIGGFTIGLTELYNRINTDNYIWMGSGQYIITVDMTPDVNKTYYYLNNNRYIRFETYIETSDTTPQSGKTYYYIEDNEYKEFEDNEFEQGIIYYELNSFTQGTTYYERRSMSIANSSNQIDNWAFIAGQSFGVTQDGQLWSNEAHIQGDIEANNFKTTGNFQIFDGTNLRMQLDEGALKFYSSDGQSLTASYGDDAIIGNPNKFHIAITANYDQTGQGRLSFYRDKDHEVAYISGNQLYITQSVVLQQMDVGQPMVDNKGGQWSWKVHTNVNGQNNLYLKWIG